MHFRISGHENFFENEDVALGLTNKDNKIYRHEERRQVVYEVNIERQNKPAPKMSYSAVKFVRRCNIEVRFCSAG